MTIQNVEASVKIENLTSKPFSISFGVCQGDPLPATIFTLTLDWVIKKLNLRRDICLKLKQIVGYAVDVALLAGSLKALKDVKNFNHLGSILNADRKMNIEIAERIAKGNKAYYANAKLTKSKFLKKNTKMKIHKMMIRPVFTYSSET